MSIANPGALDSDQRYQWLRKGDVNAFFGLMLDNIGVMILMASLLVGVFQFPRDFVLTKMIPGTAVGVLVGDLIYTLMAFALARKLKRTDVTAMPLGLDTPSVFGTVFLVLGPAFVAAKARGLDAEEAATRAWFIGIAMLFASGLFKLVAALVSGWIRSAVPRAGLLGSLTAIALVLISFLPLLDIALVPVAGLVAMWITLITLTARWPLPGRIPGALAGVVIGCILFYGMEWLGFGLGKPGDFAGGGRGLRWALPLPLLSWWDWFQGSWPEVLNYLPVAIPLALATVVGGIDCSESAAAAGDDYSTGAVIATEGFATLVGGVFGGVIQSTPYIGHPAYKAMGARAGYTLATALFVGAAGVLGFFELIFTLIPKPTIFPILIFVGLEITSQSFLATSRRHYPALALACVPALAYLADIQMNQVFNAAGKPFDAYPEELRTTLQTITMLANGFIITSLIWGMVLAEIIERRVRPACVALLLAAVFALFGVIHSPLRSAAITTPDRAISLLDAEGRATASRGRTPYHWAFSYALVAVAVAMLGRRSSTWPEEYSLEHSE